MTIAQRLGEQKLDYAVSLLFEAGQRPSARAIRKLSLQQEQFSVSIDDGSSDNNILWVELLANGLTFDLSGLAPGQPIDFTRQGHYYGFGNGQDGGVLGDDDLAQADLEALLIAPGPHLTSGGTMVPVIRCLAWLAAQLADLPGLKAICWNPARSLCAPAYFRDSVMTWIGGGPFPGFGLTALVLQADGSMVSEGLALFTGQELRLDAALVSDKSQGAKIALRLIHWLVENGKIVESMSLIGPTGETLMLEPAPKQGIVNVWKGSR